jgi:hypothetical protein
VTEEQCNTTMQRAAIIFLPAKGYSLEVVYCPFYISSFAVARQLGHRMAFNTESWMAKIWTKQYKLLRSISQNEVETKSCLPKSLLSAEKILELGLKLFLSNLNL